MVHDESPACRTLVVDVGGKTEGLLRPLRALDDDGFDQGVGGTHHAVERDAASVTDMQATTGKNFLPGFLDGVMPDQPQAAWMHTDDLLVLCPDLHEQREISLFKRIVKSLLGGFGGGKTGRHSGGLSGRARQRQEPACTWCRSRGSAQSRSW